MLAEPETERGSGPLHLLCAAPAHDGGCDCGTVQPPGNGDHAGLTPCPLPISRSSSRVLDRRISGVDCGMRQSTAKAQIKNPGRSRGSCVRRRRKQDYIAATKSGTMPHYSSCSNWVVRAAMPVYIAAARICVDANAFAGVRERILRQGITTQTPNLHGVTVQCFHQQPVHAFTMLSCVIGHLQHHPRIFVHHQKALRTFHALPGIFRSGAQALLPQEVIAQLARTPFRPQLAESMFPRSANCGASRSCATAQDRTQSRGPRPIWKTASIVQFSPKPGCRNREIPVAEPDRFSRTHYL